jgi:CheY-like chemotaxis protein
MGEAAYRRGVCYERGIGGAKDDAQAAEWYKKAADLGHAEAQERLAKQENSNVEVETVQTQAEAPAAGKTGQHIFDFEGTTEREAIDRAAKELGLNAADFDVELLEPRHNGQVRIRVHTAHSNVEPVSIVFADDDAAPDDGEIGVLIVDPSALLRNLIGRLVEDTPGLVIAEKAMNGRFALDKIPRVQPDVIILELEMPDMNGIEFLKERKKQGIDIPVVIFSSIAECEAEALALGASTFIQKPSGLDFGDICTVSDILVPMLYAYGGEYRRVKGKKQRRTT